MGRTRYGQVTQEPFAKVDRYVRRFAQSSSVGDVKVLVDSPDGTYAFAAEGAQSRHFIASSTKLFTNAVVFQLIDQGRVRFDTPVVEIVGGETLAGLVADDSLGQVTVEHLMRHTSGIADYFSDPVPHGTSLFDELITRDQSWTFDDVISRTRLMAPLGPPGAVAHYSDTNYQLLGRIIEIVSGQAYDQAVQVAVCAPLGLTSTVVMTSPDEAEGVSVMKYGKDDLVINEAMASTTADGGIISTTAESLAVLKAYYDGSLFTREYADPGNQEWRAIFRPLRYGLGQMKFHLPAAMTGFRRVNPLYGHSGASGHVMFWDPAGATYLVATVNQAKNRALVYRLMVNLQIRLPRRM